MFMAIAQPDGEVSVSDPGVVVASNVPYEQVRAAWRSALMAIVPSVWGDPAPTVAAEAMSAGIPLIASATGGLPEIVGDAGFLVQAGDDNSLATAMQKLIDDPVTRRRLGCAGRRRAHDHAIEAAADAVEEVYARIAGGSRAVPTSPALAGSRRA
jgi:glycosyltransferase involved in cell wall biosynthesis